MIENDNVKDALRFALQLTEGKVTNPDGTEVSVEYIQELIKERLINIADLLGLEELYLD